MDASFDVTELILRFVIDDTVDTLKYVLHTSPQQPSLRELRSIIRPTLRIRTVNKEFANIVNTSGVWSLVSECLGELKIIPRSVKERVPDTRIVSLCLDRGCQMCGAKGVRKIYWEMGGGAMGCRVCRDCLETNTIEKYYIEKEFGRIGASTIMDGLPRMEVESYRPKIGHITLTFFWRDDVFSDEMHDKLIHARKAHIAHEEAIAKAAEEAVAKVMGAREAAVLGVKQVLADAPQWTHIFATERVLTDLATRAYNHTRVQNKTWPPYNGMVLGFVDLVLLHCVETKIHEWMSIGKFGRKTSTCIEVVHEFVSSHEVVAAFPTKFNKRLWIQSRWSDTLTTRAIIRDCVNAIFAYIATWQ